MLKRIREYPWESSWLMTILGMTWLAVFPLVSKFSYSGFTRSKWIIALWLGGASVILALAITLLGAWRRVQWTHAGRLLMLGYFVWVALSAWQGLSADRVNADGEAIVWIGSGRFEGLSTQLCYLGIFLAMSLLQPKMKPLLAAACVGMLAFFTVIMLQYAGYNPLGLYPGFPQYYNMRTTYEFQGTMGQINMVSGFLSMMTPLLLGYWVCRGGKCGWFLLPAGCLSVLLTLMIEVDGGRLALLLATGLLVCVMLCRPETRSRGVVVLGLVVVCYAVRKLVGLPWLDGLAAPWYAEMRTDIALPRLKGDEPVIFPWNVTAKKLLIGAAGLALFACAPIVKKHPGKAVPLRALVLAGVALMLVGLLVLCVAPIPQSMGFVWEFHEVLNGRAQDSFGSERVGIWRCALELFAKSPLFGHGPDTFYPVAREYIAQGGFTLRQNFDNPHNLYFAILMQNGLPALALYLAGIAVIVVRAAKKDEGKPLAAAALCYLFQGFFTFSICIVTPVFWAILGMAVSMDEKPRLYVPAPVELPDPIESEDIPDDHYLRQPETPREGGLEA